ncbi:MAG TPA: UDP-N-acetylmuramoyl-tripeptide--D-alanyl-D-alanine ligase [Patescibacteria group bacterium]
MKSKKIIFLEKMLRFMAGTVLNRHRPKIVAITGSVGKTSTKTAVFEVLSKKYRVRENQKNYNNEIGIPLTIIGAESGGSNVFKWGWVFLKWILALVWTKYPEVLVLELGVDRPEDMKYFMSFIHPTVSIVTNIGTSHIEFFRNMDNIAKEKRAIVEALGEEGYAILNMDDERVKDMQQRTKGQVITFGQTDEATVYASHFQYNYQDGKPKGISFKLNYDGTSMPIRLPHILAQHYVYVALAAAGAGLALKMNLVEIASALEQLHTPVGRMNLLEGLKGSILIDDTYNASPLSTIAALDVLEKLEAKRRIAVLGDMLELGEQTEIGHRSVGKKIFESKVDLFVGVGKRMEYAAAELIALGFPASGIMHFIDPMAAASGVAGLVEEGDAILVKGSQGMRMEKVSEALLADQGQTENLLCRQNQAWRKKPFMQP